MSHLVKHMIVVGRYEEARKFLTELEKVAPESYLLPEHKAQLLAVRGEKEKALALDRSPIIYSLLGMKDEAVKALQKEISEGVLYPYLSLINDPRFRNLESDPRFRSIVTRAENSHKIFLKKYGNYF